MQLDAGQLADQAPAFTRILPDGNRVQAFEGMEIALVHGALFVEHNVAHEFAVITTDDIRAICHMAVLDNVSPVWGHRLRIALGFFT